MGSVRKNAEEGKTRMPADSGIHKMARGEKNLGCRDGFRIAKASHLRLWDAWESQKRAAKPPQWGAVQFECAACREAAVDIIDFFAKVVGIDLSCSMLSLSLLPFALIFY
jgi:hypothetical protein